MRAIKGELQHPSKLCQPREVKSIVGPVVAQFEFVLTGREFSGIELRATSSCGSRCRAARS
jgi:hypothetical protein